GLERPPEAPLGGWLLTAAIILLMIDIMASLALSGRLLPTQANEAVSILQLKWQQKATFWKMGFESSMAFQVIDKDFLRLPEFWARSGIYFTGKIFGTMQTRLGGDLTFTSSYRADRYFSAAGQFYQQNDTSIPALPIFEAYFSAQIRNFRVLIKGVNLSDLMFEEAYFAAPNFPYPGYHIQFAIGWRFID
ncbi:MAG: putative porin, partial [Bacteroidota bacterium]